MRKCRYKSCLKRKIIGWFLFISDREVLMVALQNSCRVIQIVTHDLLAMYNPISRLFPFPSHTNYVTPF